MQDQRQLVEYDRHLQAREKFVRQPLLFASAQLDGNNGGPNEIRVLVFDLFEEDLTFVPSGRMGVLFELVTDPSKPDRFRTQLIEVGEGYVGFRIKRLDSTGGWGQRLKIKIVGEVR